MRILMVLLGVLLFLGAFLDSKIILDHPRARFIVKILGRKGARIFYMVCGVIWIIFFVTTDKI